ncbi:DUF2306 domain-containing protein [Paraburkholderia megapolitana]|uniref:DUF2306 domain-containing protein n=1 Tax=Paraburkholderia megapolitana TaxID=420953 RepID=UPI0038B6EE39
MPLPIALHLATATLSVILGVAVLVLEKGTARHRLLGRIWAMAMFVTALSSFGIHAMNPGHFSWVHGLSLLTLVGLARAIWAIRHGNVRSHKAAIRGLFVGLAVAGIAAVAVPHRVLNVIVMGWIA